MSTRVYVYGAMRPSELDERAISDQLRLADRYYNQLIEIERWRREQVASAQNRHDRVTPFFEALQVAEQHFEAADQAIRNAKSGGGKVTETHRAEKRAAVDALRLARQRHKDAKAEARRDPALLSELREIREASQQRLREARAICGVYWGTYLLVEAAAEQAARKAIGAPPRFRRHDGSGALGVHVVGGVSVDDVLTGQCTLLRVTSPGDIWDLARGERRRRSRTTARFRIGSNEDRSPRWLDLQIIMHRPLPPTARIKNAKLLRKRVGLRFEYELHIVLDDAFDATVPVGEGTVAINFGWRRKFIGSEHVATRVAYWLDENGHAGEIEVPTRTTTGLEKVDDLRSIRDKNFNAARAALQPHVESVPEALRERLRYLHQWRAPARLARLAHAWARHVGDGAQPETLIELLAWAQQDRHLLAWEAHQRDRRINHRNEHYRVSVVALARRYARIITGVQDLRKFRTLPEPEVGDPADNAEQRSTAFIAAPGEARLELKHAARKYGARYVEVSSVMITQRCVLCGCAEKWNARPSILHTCVQCGEEWDQDRNACLNLLTNAEELSADAEPLESDDSDGDAATIEVQPPHVNADMPGCSQ